MTIRVNPDWWKLIFDEVYLLTDARSVCDPEITRREIDMVRELVPIEPDHRVLDLCGGQGRHSLELAAHDFSELTVLDYSSCLIEHGKRRARELGRPIEFIQADARDTGLEAESFDHVLILGNSMGYLPSPEDDAAIIREAFRVLAPGGRLLADLANGSAVRERMQQNAWHEINDEVVVCRERELVDGCIHAREVVISKEHGLIRDGAYAIRLYEPLAIVELVRSVGFDEVKVITDFSVHDGNGDYGFMNHRMIVTAVKV